MILQNAKKKSKGLRTRLTKVCQISQKLIHAFGDSNLNVKMHSNFTSHILFHFDSIEKIECPKTLFNKDKAKFCNNNTA